MRTTPLEENIVISESGSAHAPFVYFEQASALRYQDGTVGVTLEALRMYPNHKGAGITADRVVTARLRMGVAAARSVRAAIDSALLLATPAESRSKN